ncbi:MAG: hypothetical protein BZY79_03495 [SAR202 cluster bacterium Casp-Chloro-G4]|nr:serine/threonine-protein kinase [Chloroflexota bacterium]MDA1227828.1 serine/threonine-protein kinase [Chloroflexota bacterium]PKB61440.1 MAG: hypothetical protein BZY79_03495 [SAR202 cluster bacterium Casp-Chloro-G4]
MASILEGGRLGRYYVQEKLGSGGMATVFKARDPSLDRTVAIKVLAFLRADEPAFRERFSREAQAIARLNHPHILQVYDVGEDKGFTYIVTEYVSGGTLLERLGSPHDLGEALRILRPLAEALDFAHSNGIVHRDIKPSNVLMRDEGEPVLADFGLSVVMEQVYHITAPQEAIGTPEYMSPEQAMGRDVDSRSDLYAFGILCYQILVGEVPFHANTAAATMMAHVHQPLPLSESDDVDLLPGVKATLLKAMAKNPDDRYQSAMGLVEALAASLPRPQMAPVVLDSPTVVLPNAWAYSAPDYQEAPSSTGGHPLRRLLPGLSRRLLVATGIAAGVVAVIMVALALAGDSESPLASGITSAPGVEPISNAPATPAASDPTPSESIEGTEADLTPEMSLAEAMAAFNQTVALVQSRVSSLRGLAPVTPIESNLETTDKLQDLADAHFKRRFLRDQVFQTEELYKTLGLLQPEDDLEDITREVFLQQVTALFDDASGRLYVLSDAPNLGPAEELSYASVFLAGVQEQVFFVSDLRRAARESGNSDEYRALTAFASGEVAQIQQGYVQTYFTESELAEVTRPIPGNRLESAPQVVRDVTLFPQREGSDFVGTVYQSAGSWQGVDDVYSSPPVSTEQIIHPEKYLAGEKPDIPALPDITADMGRGWELVAEDTLGEFLLRTFLEKNLDAFTASAAAAGWGGDRYLLLIGPEAERLLVLSINWDSIFDATEFEEAHSEFASVDYGGPAAPTSDGRRMWSGNQGATLMKSEPKSTLLVMGDSEALVQRALSALGIF